jgi:Anaphase-promoting complex, cyclosome, subunit 4
MMLPEILKSPSTSVSFSPDGKLISITGADGSVSIFSGNNEQLYRVIECKHDHLKELVNKRCRFPLHSSNWINFSSSNMKNKSALEHVSDMLKLTQVPGPFPRVLEEELDPNIAPDALLSAMYTVYSYFDNDRVAEGKHIPSIPSSMNDACEADHVFGSASTPILPLHQLFASNEPSRIRVPCFIKCIHHENQDSVQMFAFGTFPVANFSLPSITGRIFNLSSNLNLESILTSSIQSASCIKSPSIEMDEESVQSPLIEDIVFTRITPSRQLLVYLQEDMPFVSTLACIIHSSLQHLLKSVGYMYAEWESYRSTSFARFNALFSSFPQEYQELLLEEASKRFPSKFMSPIHLELWNVMIQGSRRPEFLAWLKQSTEAGFARLIVNLDTAYTALETLCVTHFVRAKERLLVLLCCFKEYLASASITQFSVLNQTKESCLTILNEMETVCFNALKIMSSLRVSLSKVRSAHSCVYTWLRLIAKEFEKNEKLFSKTLEQIQTESQEDSAPTNVIEEVYPDAISHRNERRYNSLIQEAWNTPMQLLAVSELQQVLEALKPISSNDLEVDGKEFEAFSQSHVISTIASSVDEWNMCVSRSNKAVNEMMKDCESVVSTSSSTTTLASLMISLSNSFSKLFSSISTKLNQESQFHELIRLPLDPESSSRDNSIETGEDQSKIDLMDRVSISSRAGCNFVDANQGFHYIGTPLGFIVIGADYSPSIVLLRTSISMNGSHSNFTQACIIALPEHTRLLASAPSMFDDKLQLVLSGHLLETTVHSGVSIASFCLSALPWVTLEPPLHIGSLCDAVLVNLLDLDVTNTLRFLSSEEIPGSFPSSAAVSLSAWAQAVKKIRISVDETKGSILLGFSGKALTVFLRSEK